MQKMLTHFFGDVIRRPSLYLFGFLIIFSTYQHKRYEVSESRTNGPFTGEVYESYSFLPEFFLDYEQVPGINFYTSQRTIGMAMLYSPAFLVGHGFARYAGAAPDGYSRPYQEAVRWGSILYCLLGLYLCRKSLLVFFSEPVTAISLACIFFATNLFFYTYGQGELPHSYLFFLNAAFLFFTLKWLRESKPLYLLLIAFCLGTITLIRPTGILCALFPLLYNVQSRSDLFARIKYFFRNDLTAFLSCLLFLLPLALQMLVWKVYKGQFIYDGYGDEHFFFSDPQVRNFLFSFRKGWLVYTPVMLLSLAGMLFSRGRIKEFYPFLPIYFLASLYVFSCWWDWAYGNSFGCRALIGSYAFLVFPFAASVASLWHLRKDNPFQKNLLRLAMLFVFYLFIQLNLFQSRQYKQGSIHSNGMNWTSYKRVFLKDIPSEEAGFLRSYSTSPDLKKMKSGEDRNQ